MQGRRFDRFLTGTAIALALGLTAVAGPASAQDQSAIEALVPMPEPANLPPPTAADVGGPTTETTGTANALVLPDLPDLPPPSFTDVATPSAPGLFGSFQFATYGGLALYFAPQVVTGSGALFVFLLYVVQIGLHLVTAGIAVLLYPAIFSQARAGDIAPR